MSKIEFFKRYSLVVLLWFGLFCDIILFGITQDGHTDVWGQALHGRILFEKQRLARFSDYSCVPDQDNPEQLNQISQYFPFVLFYLLLRFFGYWGLIGFKIVVISAVCLVLLKIMKLRNIPLIMGMVSCLLFFYLGYSRFAPRPDFLNILFLSIYLYILEKYNQCPGRYIWILPFLQILWVNIHPLGIGSIGVVAVYALAHYSQRRRESGHTLLLVSLSISLACFLNPEGYRQIFTPFNILLGLKREEYLFGNIREFMPIARIMSPMSIGLYYSTIAVVLFLSVVNRNMKNWCYLALFIILAIATYRLTRVLGLFAGYSAFLVPLLLWESLQKYIFHLQWVRNKLPALRLAMGNLVALALFALGISLANQSFFKKNDLLVRCSPYPSNLLSPVEAVKFLKQHRFSGNIYTDYNSGGYVGYHLYPQGKIFIDSLATSVYPVSHYRLYERISTLEITPVAAIIRYKIDLFLLQYTGGENLLLIDWLYRSQEWLLVYLDEGTIIFAHRNSPLPQKVTFLDRSEIAAVRHVPRIANSSTNLLKLATFFECLRLTDAAEATFLDVVKIDEKQPIAFNNLGAIAANRGEYERALEFYVKSCQADADYEIARVNICQLFQHKLQFDADNSLHKMALKLCPSIRDFIQKR